MKETNRPIDELIADYLARELSPDGLTELHAWISSSEENKAYFLRQQEIWFSALEEKEAQLYDAEAAFEHFQKRVAKATHHPSTVPHRRLTSRLLRYAAAVAGICLMTYFSYRKGADHLQQSLTQITVEVPMGSQTRLCLPDQTIVTLNAGSRLSYPQEFGINSREVELEGEGFFEVTHNAEQPFCVRSKSIEVNVLGTQFNFKDYPNDETVSVSLYQGKVSLDNRLQPESPMQLRPNECMVMNKLNGKMNKEEHESKDSFLWTQGELMFKNTRLTEILHTLERSYGVHIRLETDSLKDIRFNGRFKRAEYDSKEILQTLKATGRISYRINENEIIVY